MEYQILLEMIEEYKFVDSIFLKPGHGFHTDADKAKFAVLLELQRRIDKARESDIIAMSNEGCV